MTPTKIDEPLEPVDGYYRYANAAYGSIPIAANCVFGASVQSANVVPDASWTHEQMVDFAEKYPSYCYSLVTARPELAPLFVGIELPVPKYVQEEHEREWRRANRWSWANLVAHVKEMW